MLGLIIGQQKIEAAAFIELYLSLETHGLGRLGVGRIFEGKIGGQCVQIELQGEIIIFGSRQGAIVEVGERIFLPAIVLISGLGVEVPAGGKENNILPI